MRTATTTKDERRGGAVGKRKKGATGFIALPLRSQDHLITFPTQLYLGREFDVSIRIEIGLIPIRTTLVHTANMEPAKENTILGIPFMQAPLKYRHALHCTTIKPLCLFIPLLSFLIIPSSRTKALVLAPPDRRRWGVQIWNSLSLLGRSSSAAYSWAPSRTWTSMCMCGRRVWTSNLQEGPDANVRRL